MSIKHKIFSFVILLSLFISALQVSPAAALSITGISPAIAPNNVSTEVTISGTDFLPDVQVTLIGTTDTEELTLQSWSETSLVVIVPAGLTAGIYTVSITSPVSPTPPPAEFHSFTVQDAPTATPLPPAFGRPQIVIDSYRTNVGEIIYNEEFNLVVRLHNAGQVRASNIQAVFSSPDLTPTKTGGVSAVPGMDADGRVDIAQKMRATTSLYGKAGVQVDLSITYYDDKGAPYSEKFTLNVPVKAINYAAAATATPTGMKRSQLVITSYDADVEILQPGSLFSLEIGVQNLGNASARNVTMIIGGGSSGGSGANGTPQPGGVSGGSGEFTNFAPVGASNIQSLGDFAPGASLVASQKLIVNVSTNPGAYPMKITFSYLDESGNTINDDQVITLLVYSLPNVDVSFYQPVGTLFVGQPNFLPLQVVNLGKKMSVLGSMKVTTTGGALENAQTLVGSIESGGYFTLDAMVYPDAAGPLDLTVTIDYTDDFNQSRTITQPLTLDVIEMEEMPFDPNFPEGGGGGGGEGFPPMEQEETFWQKAWRFVLGLFGLDSGQPVEQPAPMYEEEMIPVEPGMRSPKGG
ncbi:MAG: IPT/TIG domain-containing protein [Anaerolineae bacterium]|nr:IPT/TIG domain-containing protein [Anaerolineae bacterium]